MHCHHQDGCHGHEEGHQHVQAESDPARSGEEAEPPGAVVGEVGQERLPEPGAGAIGTNGG